MSKFQLPAKSDRQSIPRTVWVLGFVSLLMDISSEMIHALLPLFMATTLGASAVWIGFTEGMGEAAALISKVFSGAIADRFGKKKWLVFTGYALGVISKPFFALAGSMPVVFGARFFDRIGKGIRGAPRDAIIAEVTPENIRGAAYGLRQSLDAAGAFIGITGFSHLLSYALRHFRNITLATLTGFMLGSLNKVWPWKEIADNSHGMPIETNTLPDSYIIEAAALMLAGFLLVYFLEKLSARKS